MRLRQRFATKWDAITAAGELLVAGGHAAPEYVALMLARERLATTYVGNGVALPHATREGMALVREAGMSHSKSTATTPMPWRGSRRSSPTRRAS